jgi:hypothetical protein
MFEVVFTEGACEDLRFLKKAKQGAILDAVEIQLSLEPLLQTRNRKPLRGNDLASWKMRVGFTAYSMMWTRKTRW